MSDENNGIDVLVVEQALEVRATGLCNMVARADVLNEAYNLELVELQEWIEGLPRRSKGYYDLLSAMTEYLTDTDK